LDWGAVKLCPQHVGHVVPNYQLTSTSLGVWQPPGVAGIPAICSFQDLIFWLLGHSQDLGQMG
jgi:hypothetical protein